MFLGKTHSMIPFPWVTYDYPSSSQYLEIDGNSRFTCKVCRHRHRQTNGSLFSLFIGLICLAVSTRFPQVVFL